MLFAFSFHINFVNCSYFWVFYPYLFYNKENFIINVCFTELISLNKFDKSFEILNYPCQIIESLGSKLTIMMS